MDSQPGNSGLYGNASSAHAHSVYPNLSGGVAIEYSTLVFTLLENSPITIDEFYLIVRS
ncbi:hypothetical protein AVEN_154733-1, partial [Araneus ventricosus]